MAEMPDLDMFDRLAHDLRGPLTPLKTAAFLLRRSDQVSDRQNEVLDIIDRQTTRLNCMIQEIADWQCAMQGRLRRGDEITQLDVLIGLACEDIRTIPQVRLELGDEIGAVGIAGDAQRLSQMFAILVAYAQARAVDNRVCVSGRLAEIGAVVEITCRVGEKGSAGSDGRIDFSRPEASPFDEGLGWRLMIANAIALAHDGSLGADSGPGDDVQRIHVRLPMQGDLA